MSEQPTQAAPNAAQALIELVTESWRFSRVFARALTKLDAGESTRFVSQYRYFIKRMEEALESGGMKLVNIEGHPYDPGLAVTALNLGDFDPEDVLIVDQMIEPIIMSAEGLVRAGTVMLRKVEA